MSILGRTGGPRTGARETVPRKFCFEIILAVLGVFFLAPAARAEEECLPVDFVGTCTANQTCFRSFDWLSANVTDSANTGNKGFQCTMTEDSPQVLRDLVVPDQTLVNCAPNNCTFTLAINAYDNLVRCEQGGCVQSGQTMECETLSCDCDDDPGCKTASAIVQALATGAKGRNVFNCTTTPDDTSLYHMCVLEIPGFILARTPLECRTGQCVNSFDLDGDPVVSNEEIGDFAVDYMGQPVNTVLNAVVSAIPTMVLVLVTSAVLAHFFLFVASLYKVDADGVSVVVDGCGDGAPAASNEGSADPSPSPAPQLETPHTSPETGRLEFSISAKVRLSPLALQRRLGNVRGRTKLSFPGIGAKGDVEFGSSEARRTVSKLHMKADEPNQWYILDSCVGLASSGTVTGIMGPSGCGKTTLLSCLSGAGHASLKSLHVTGKVTWNGNPVHQSASIAFVPQMDSLIPTMTVREQLLFVGRLKNPRIQVDQVRAKVKGVLEELGIDDIADQYLGGASARSISGGERRRVMIGTALVSSPRMIVLDEPLSGLDSYNALVVTSTLKSLAASGRTVLYSLHQPSDDIYMSLDRAIFMAHGRVVYQGPPADCRSLLKGAGIDMNDPKKAHLLADTMLYALNDPITCQGLIEAGSRSEIVNADRGKISQSTSFKHDVPPLTLQASLVFWRALVDIWRNRSLLALHVCTP